MTRAIVDQKFSALLSAEARLDRTLRESPTFDEIWASYRKAEDEYNEAFDAWWHSRAAGVVPEPSGNLGDVA
jgi:hypothetical protein